MSRIEAQRKINEDEIDLVKVFHALRDKWFYFMLSFIIFGALAVVYLLFALPVYEGTSSIIVKDAKAPGGDASQIINDGGMFGSQTNVSNQKAILGSYSVLSKVVQNLHLRTLVYNETSYPPYPLYKRLPFAKEIISINKFYQNGQKFYIKPSGLNKFELKCEYDGSKMPEFTYNELHTWGQPIKTKYFEFMITKSDTVKFDPEITGYSFVCYDEPTAVSNSFGHLTIEDADKIGTIINLTYKDNLPAGS
ncbi:MAG: hypothetical protein IPO27_08090 [Bacteroidetes bacterium]|nr:hypothetical protein [Bacteroidota bacterium]